MTALVASIITAVVTAILAAVGTYVTTRRNLQIQFDASLREMRIAVYKPLWARLAGLAKYARPEPLSRHEAQELAETLRDWYFETGGLFLSQETRRDYFALHDALEVVPRRASGETLSVEDDELLRVLSSRLRTGMTRDVGTRRTFIFREDADRARQVARPHTYVEDGGGRRLRIAPRRWQRLPWIGRLIPGPAAQHRGARATRALGPIEARVRGRGARSRRPQPDRRARVPHRGGLRDRGPGRMGARRRSRSRKERHLARDALRGPRRLVVSVDRT